MMKLKQLSGFALLEVLVALVIISVAMLSLIYVCTNSINTMKYLEDKTTAQWVASNIANQIQLGMQPLSSSLEPLHGTMEMLNHQWYWSAQFEATEGGIALRAIIDIKPEANAAVILHFTTYLTPTIPVGTA